MNFNDLLSNTDSLMNQVFWFQQQIDKPKAASHRGVAINYVDLAEMKDIFIMELKSTALSWVYSNKKYQELMKEELINRNNDVMSAHSYLQQVANKKFRRGHAQGQLGELLLFNFIQFFFKAPPLLRKMPITTNPAIERHGADAIHYREDGGVRFFFLGESKCYESKYKFNEALKVSIDSIIKSYTNIANEMILYSMDDFIAPELQKVAKDFKDGKLSDVRFELVCLVTYEETKKIDASSESQIKENIKKCISERWARVADDIYSGVRLPLIERIHYVVFPVWGLDELLKEF